MASVTGAEGSNYDRVPIINFDCMGNKVLILLNPNSVLGNPVLEIRFVDKKFITLECEVHETNHLDKAARRISRESQLIG